MASYCIIFVDPDLIHSQNCVTYRVKQVLHIYSENTRTEPMTLLLFSITVWNLLYAHVSLVKTLSWSYTCTAGNYNETKRKVENLTFFKKKL